MFYHKCIPNFADPNDPNLDNKVLDEIIKFNSSTLNLNIDSSAGCSDITIDEPDQLGVQRHHIHIGNMFKKEKIKKIMALFIVSSRDYVQGGELMFENWDEPKRTDNFGAVIGSDENAYPYELNEQGTLIIIPAIEKVWSRRVVSGSLKLKKYIVMGDNYV